MKLYRDLGRERRKGRREGVGSGSRVDLITFSEKVEDRRKSRRSGGRKEVWCVVLQGYGSGVPWSGRQEF